MEYKILKTTIAGNVLENILRINDDETETIIPINESNSDYQQYLIDTDGGLPIPEEKSK